MAYQNCPQRLHPIHWDPVTFIVSIIPKSCEVADVPHHSLGINKVPNTWPLILRRQKTRTLDMRPLLLPFVKRKLGSRSGVGFFCDGHPAFFKTAVSHQAVTLFFSDDSKNSCNIRPFCNDTGTQETKKCFCDSCGGCGAWLFCCAGSQSKK